MANYKKARSEEVEDRSRRKKSPRQREGKVMKAPGEEMASHSAAAEDPVALLSGPEMAHPANASLRARIMTELQRQRGNTYVQRLIRSAAIQAKLTVNPPDDVYEREADRVAEEVMRVPEPQLRRQVEAEEEEEEILQTKSLTGQATPLAQGQVEPEEEEEEEILQTKSLTGKAAPLTQRQVEPEEEEEPIEMKRIAGGTPEVTPELEARIQGQKGGGQALDNKVRGQMESAFGADLSDVRAHANAEADSLARELGARAFTTGKDIFFSEGSYQPSSESGKKLIGHELTHVVQQEGNGDVRQKPRPVLVKDAFREGEAEAVAPRPSSSHEGEEKYPVLGIERADQQPLIARQRERGPLEAEEDLAKDIKKGLEDAGKRLEDARKLLEVGQKLSNRDLGRAVGALNKVSHGVGRVASAAGKAESVLGLTNTIGRFDKAWDEYFADPSEANLRKLQKHLDATIGAFQDSAGILNKLVPGIGRYVSGLLGIGRRLVGAFTSAIAMKKKRLEAVGKGPLKRRGPAPPVTSERDRKTAEEIARSMAELQRELNRVVKPRHVQADVERVFSKWRRAQGLTSITRPMVIALNDFKAFCRGAIDGLDKLEGLSWHEKILTEKDKVYKDKIRWGSKLARDALIKLEKEMGKIDVLSMFIFEPDRKALIHLELEHGKEK